MSVERDLLGRWHNGDLLPEEYMKLMKETKELLAQPEPINFDLERMKLAVESPVSDITGEELMKQVKTNRVFYQEGYAQAELDLKREPLGEEESYHEAKRLYEAEDGLWYQDGFIDGLKFAEKMHGIGGGE